MSAIVTTGHFLYHYRAWTDLPPCLPFVKWSQRRESSISVDFSDYSGQHLHSPDESETPKSRPCTASTTSSIKPRTSWIFSHMPDEEIETGYYNERTGKEEWRYKHCDRAYACSGGTAAPVKHLMDPPPDGHGLPRGAPRTTKVTTIRTILERARAVAEGNPHKRRRLNDQPGDSINPDQLEVLYVRFITACSLPFRLVECPEFRALLAYINKDVDTWLPDTHETIRKWIMRQYEDQKEKVKQRMQSAKSRIHISCDLWTSPNSLAILGIVAHYVTEDGQLEHHVLALKDIDSEHDGSHLAVAVLNVVDEWGFASKLGYFVMDNAGNNDTMMRSLSLGLLRRYDIQYDPKVHRLRCQGHIINLAAKAFLFITDDEKLEVDDPSVHNVTLRHIEAWRKKGPLGKLHNFVVFIQRSVQRGQKFLAVSHNHKLARDNDTRWSSWYNVLRVALNLRDAIDGYFNKWMESDCAGDELSPEDWVILEKVKSFLEKLKMTTKALESSFATLDNVLLAMDFVLAQFEAGKEATMNDPVMAPMYNSGWAKLDKYYRLLKNRLQEWIEPSKKLIETLWNEYKPMEPLLPLCEVPSTTTNEFLNWRNKHLQPSLTMDEYERYCNSERVYGFTSALAWWLEETQQKTYPNLTILKNSRVKCKHCGHETAKGTTRQKKHLHRHCPNYRGQQQSEQSQLTQHFPVVDKTFKQMLDELAARAIFADGRPFNLFESKRMQILLRKLNTAWQPPSRRRVQRLLARPILSTITKSKISSTRQNVST
ncbi:hypothetical protein FOMA001_g13235 [Fusarium oxysporum f. sp. matthiolae]|nr:hypothetical protein FOMA001_g13235 [Fusarium oxysporum f. sp. matthiolae]